jgi:hypothetical protein
MPKKVGVEVSRATILSRIQGALNIFLMLDALMVGVEVSRATVMLNTQGALLARYVQMRKRKFFDQPRSSAVLICILDFILNWSYCLST